MPVHSDNATVERFYRWNAPIYDLTRWPILRGRRRAVRALNLTPGAAVMEIGCGTGLNLPLFQRAVGPTGRIVGVDFSAEMLARASRRCTPNTELLRADASTLDLSTRFDAVFAGYSLTIIPPWREAMRRGFAHLRPGGVFVILDFGRGHAGSGWFKRAFDRYLALNHVDAARDLKGQLELLTPHVEAVRRTDAFYTILRARREARGA